MSNVTVYVTQYCGFCTSAKRWLTGMNIEFESIDVTTDHAKRQWLVEKTGMRTVPQIFVGEHPVGGYQEMRAMDNRGEFRPLLEREGVSFSAP